MLSLKSSLGLFGDRAKRKLIINSMVYISTGFLQKAGNFLLVPFLIATLSPADFSRFGLYLSLLALLPRVLSLNVHSAATRLVFDFNSSKSRATLLKTSLLIGGGTTGLGVASVFLVLHLLDYRDPASLGIISLQITIAATILVIVGVDFALAVARVYSKAGVFATISIARTLGPLILYLLLTIWASGSYAGVLYTYALALTGVCLYSLYATKPYFIEGHFRWDFAKSALQFSFPTVISFLSLWLISSSGRWIGAYFIPLAALADYTLLTISIGAIGMIVRALFDARIPTIGTTFSSSHYVQGKLIVWRTSLAAAILVTFAYIGIFLLGYVINLPIPPAYVPDLELLAMSYFISVTDCIYIANFQMLIALKKTGMQALAMIIAGITVVVVSIILVREFLAFGLLLSTATGYIIQSVILYVVAQREYRHATSLAKLSVQG